MQQFAEFLQTVLIAYAAVGAVFAVAFAIAGVQRVDSQAKGSSLGFRLLIVPGAATLWPMLLRRWMRGDPNPPIENNAHRTRAGVSR